jgi:hypothetical protein
MKNLFLKSHFKHYATHPHSTNAHVIGDRGYLVLKKLLIPDCQMRRPIFWIRFLKIAD